MYAYVILQIHSSANNRNLHHWWIHKTWIMCVSIVNDWQLQLQVEQRRRTLMDLPLPLKTAMGATAWQQWRQEIAMKIVSKSAFRLSTNDSSVMGISYVYWTSTMTMRGHRDFIEGLTVGVSWETGCSRNESKLVTYTCILKALHLRVPVYSHLSCWAHGALDQCACVYVTNDVCICFSLSTQFLCCSYPVWDPCIICSLHVVWCACTDCMCLTQARPTTSCIPLVFALL